MQLGVADSAAPALQSTGNMTDLHLWLCCTSNIFQNYPNSDDSVWDFEHNTYRMTSPSRMQAALCPSCHHVWRGVWAPRLVGVKQHSALQLARSVLALVAERRADTGGRGLADTVEAAEDRRPVSDPTVRFDRNLNITSEPRAALHLGRSCSASSDDYSSQLVISCSLSNIGGCLT